MKEVTLKLNEKDVELIMNLLAEVPYKTSYQTIHSIQAQIKEALEAGMQG